MLVGMICQCPCGVVISSVVIFSGGKYPGSDNAAPTTSLQIDVTRKWTAAWEYTLIFPFPITGGCEIDLH